MKKTNLLYVIFAVITILLLTLTACQPAAEEETVTAANESNENKVGGTFVYAVSVEPDSLDPAVTGASVSDIIMNMFGCSLVSLDKEGNIVPYVASSWDVTEDGLTYTFHLRDDVKYANGKSVTAQDFAFEYNRALDPETASQSTGPSLGDVASITALDDLTLEVKLNTANYPFLISISDAGYMQPVNQEDFEAAGADAFARGPIGCGPYKAVSWETGSKITVERNPDYNWGPSGAVDNTGAYYIEKIEFRIIPEIATITAGLENGEIDFAAITQTDKEYLSTLDNIETIGSLQPGLKPYIAINTSHAPFDDINVRKAFNMAIDRDAALQLLAKGEGQVQYGPLSPSQIGYWDGIEEIGYKYDPDQAASLMEESGYTKDADGYWGKDGSRISLTLYTLPVDTWIKAAELVQQQYAEFGIELTIEQSEQGVLIPIILGGEYDITMFGMTATEADIMYMMFHSSQIGGFNYAMVNDPTLDEILERTRTEIDPDARQQAVNEAQKYIVEQAYLIPLYVPVNYYAIDTRIKDYHISDIRGLDLDSAYIEQ